MMETVERVYCMKQILGKSRGMKVEEKKERGTVER